MSQPFVGEIRMFAGNFAPAGWLFCDGSTLPISENETLFQLIGTTYGGDGEQTFNLPNLSGRLPVCAGTNPATGTTHIHGEMSGVESVTLTSQQIPVHTHAALGSVDPATSNAPQNAVPASLTVASGQLPYGTDPPPTSLQPASIAPVGGSQPHDNTQPILVVSFIISLFGIFPSQTVPATSVERVPRREPTERERAALPRVELQRLAVRHPSVPELGARDG